MSEPLNLKIFFRLVWKMDSPEPKQGLKCTDTLRTWMKKQIPASKIMKSSDSDLKIPGAILNIKQLTNFSQWSI